MTVTAQFIQTAQEIFQPNRPFPSDQAESTFYPNTGGTPAALLQMIVYFFVFTSCC